MRRILVFKNHPTIKGAIIPRDNIKRGDKVVLHGRGNPKGVVVKVDRSKAKGGSVWYDIKLATGRVITRRAWDFKEVYR